MAEEKVVKKRRSKVAAEKVSEIDVRVNEIAQKAAELEELKQKALEEKEQAERDEASRVAIAKERIEAILREENLFCGAILNKVQILQIVKLAMDTQDETIKIPFALYYND